MRVCLPNRLWSVYYVSIPPTATGAQKHTPIERARERAFAERARGVRAESGSGGGARTSPTAPFRICVARGVQVHQQCKSLRLSRKAQHFAGKGEGGRTGRGRLGQPASQSADLFSQVKSVKSVWQSFWTGGRVDVFYVPLHLLCAFGRSTQPETSCVAAPSVQSIIYHHTTNTCIGAQEHQRPLSLNRVI